MISTPDPSRLPSASLAPWRWSALLGAMLLCVPQLHARTSAAPPADPGLPTAPAWLAQEDEEPPMEDEREVVEALLDQLKPLLRDRKGLRDDEALALVDQLLTEFPVSGPKDREDIVDGVADCLSVKRLEKEDGSANELLQRGAAVALGRMGPESAEVLVRHIDHKAFREAKGAHADLLRSVGRVQAPKGVKPLQGMLECGDYGVEAAAAQALGMYVDLEGDDRKDIFEKLLKTIMPLQQIIEQGEGGDANYDEFRKRYDTISASIRNALASLSGHEERDFNTWRQWWNDNRRRDWDEAR